MTLDTNKFILPSDFKDELEPSDLITKLSRVLKLEVCENNVLYQFSSEIILLLHIELMEKKLTKQGLRSPPLGRIKILVAKRSKLSYYKAVGAAVAVGLVNLFLGAVNMTALLYSMLSNDIHVVLCSAAFHFFSAEAIIGLSPFNGWSGPLNVHHRTFVHVFLQLCALICACIGSTMILFEKGMTVSVHAVSSIVTLSLALFCLGTGPGALLTPRYFSIPHVLFGMPTMVVASISFISGLFMPQFDMYFDPSVKYILLAFIVYSAVVITAIALRRFLSWL